MATAVERPLSNTMNREIIDVDEFDFSSQGHRERVYFVDSDGEEDLIEILSPRLQPSSIDGSRPTRRFVSGGPRRNPSVPPPVPAIPARFSAHPTSFPRRRQAQSTGLPNLPPVIPSQEPLAFELFGSSPERHPTASPAPVPGPSTRRASPPRAAPPSHHTPSMGLGGALISSNRRETLENQQRQRARQVMEMRRRAFMGTFGPEGSTSGSGSGAASSSGSGSGAASGSGSSRRRRWHAIANNIEDLFTGVDDDDHAHQHIHMLVNTPPHTGPPGWGWQSTGMSWHDLALGHMAAGAESRDKEQYQQRYTHPLRPEPGFTFDFDGAQADAPIVLDDDGVVVTPDVHVTSSLVCARCSEPLVLNAAMAEEEAALKRIWALRCGHVIDEKCLNEIGQPNEEEEAQEPPVKIDRKGKGKAKAAPSFSSLTAEPAPAPVAQESEAGGISSRLRSRIAATASALYSMVDPSSSQPPIDDSPPRPPPAKKRRVAQRKPKIEGTFMWACPVPSCRREHVSVKIAGVWGPEKEVPKPAGRKAQAAVPPQEPRGAIPVFA